jgi:hypothetical protein
MRESGKMIKDTASELKSGLMETNMSADGHKIKKKEKAFSTGKTEIVMLALGKTIKFGD